MDQAEKVYAVKRMQDYVELHLTEEITLKQLAETAGYSPWYAAKIFKEITGKAPFDYIRMLRLTGAARVLQEGKSKVLDVALDFVFDSHEGFTRAFTKNFGISPKRYQKDAPPIPFFMPEDVYLVYLQFKKGGINMNAEKTNAIFVQVVERPERKALIKRGIKADEYFAYCEEVGCDIWGVLCSVKEALYEPVGMWLPKSMIKEGTSEYVQGVEVPLDYNKTIPEGYELITLPACKYMIFQGEPYEEEQMGQAIGVVWEKIRHFNPSVYGYEFAPDIAPRFQLSPMGYRGYIEGRPVR